MRMQHCSTQRDEGEPLIGSARPSKDRKRSIDRTGGPMVQLRTTPPELVSLLLVRSPRCLRRVGGISLWRHQSRAGTPDPRKRPPARRRRPRMRQLAAPTAGHHRLGEPLADPSRYYGLYASADRPDRRQWFVAEAKRPAYAEQAPEVPPGASGARRYVRRRRTLAPEDPLRNGVRAGLGFRSPTRTRLHRVRARRRRAGRRGPVHE